jgi:substrate import-associated zinc metallohydrolase lipoprotein
MKATRFYIFILLLTLGAAACSPDDDVAPGSNLSTEAPAKNELDQWIHDNFTKPYNIEVVYRWSESLVDQSRFLYPPAMDSVKPALTIVRNLWIDPYSTVGGEAFVKKIAPRQLVLVGGRNVNPSGTILLGLAEGGKRVSLFEIDLLNKKSRAEVDRFIHTIQHEYVHILNQTRPIDEGSYGQISPEGYTAQWFNESLQGSQQAGFITSYARANEQEDFAEMASTMLNLSRTEWDNTINNIGVTRNANGAVVTDVGALGRDRIRRKERMVVDYYKSELNLDLYVLQDSVYRATQRIIK